MTINAIISNDTVENWLKFLIDYQNFTYMFAERTLPCTRNHDGQMKMNILKEIAGLFPSGIYLEEGSPYKNRFDRSTCKDGLAYDPNHLCFPFLLPFLPISKGENGIESSCKIAARIALTNRAKEE